MKVLDSSVHGRIYTIDAVCKNCTTWSLGSIDKTSTKQPFIFGLGPTDERISSDAMTARVPRHAVYGALALDMTQASAMNAKIPTTNTDNGSYVSSGSASIDGGAQDDYDWSRPIHGVFMAVAFVLLFPSGVLVLRLLEHVLWHGIIQAVGWLFVIIGAGSGIYLSEEYNMVCSRLIEVSFRPHASTNANASIKKTQGYHTTHQIIGIMIFVFATVQLLLGLVHHVMYRRTQRPTILGKIHLYLGPPVLILGIVNTPLGLNLAGDGRYNITYAIVVAILASLFFAARFGKVWNTRAKRAEHEDDSWRREDDAVSMMPFGRKQGEY